MKHVYERIEMQKKYFRMKSYNEENAKRDNKMKNTTHTLHNTYYKKIF